MLCICKPLLSFGQFGDPRLGAALRIGESLLCICKPLLPLGQFADPRLRAALRLGEPYRGGFKTRYVGIDRFPQAPKVFLGDRVAELLEHRTERLSE